MRPLRQLTRIIACALGAHRGPWHRTEWNRIKVRHCRHCGAPTYRTVETAP